MRLALCRLSQAEHATASAMISDHVIGSSRWTQSTTVALFHPLSGEVDLRQLWDCRGDRRIALPAVTGKDLEFRWVRDLCDLTKGAFGIMEPPADAEPIDVATIEMILVPGLAFDRMGGRLGRGAGFYDRQLQSIPRERCVGVGFSLQMVPSVPREPHDVKLGAVVTEEGWLF